VGLVNRLAQRRFILLLLALPLHAAISVRMQPRDFLSNSLETPKIGACLRSMSDCASFFIL
jgi:hypothetical protein